MSVVETVLVYVLIPVGTLAVMAVLTMTRGRGARPRYRAGQPWDHAPVWWSANPEGVGSAHHSGAPQLTAGASATTTTVGGGARGTW